MFKGNSARWGRLGHVGFGAMNRAFAIFIVVLAAIAAQPLMAADRLPDNYTGDGKPVRYPMLSLSPDLNGKLSLARATF
jgi:hypothetical protein